MRRIVGKRLLTFVLVPAIALSPGLQTIAIGDEAVAGNDTSTLLEPDESVLGVIEDEDPIVSSEANETGIDVVEEEVSSDVEEEQNETAIEVADDEVIGDGLRTAAEGVSMTLSGRCYLSKDGWQAIRKLNTANVDARRIVVGEAGKGRMLQKLRLSLSPVGCDGGIDYKGLVEGTGWTDWKSSGSTLGKKGKRIEAIRLKLTGEVANQYDLYYRVYSQKYGWLGWTSDGCEAGTGGKSLHVEAIELAVVDKGESFLEDGSKAAYRDRGLRATGHVQGTGWKKARTGWKVRIGSTGKSKRLEAFTIDRPSVDLSGSIVYKAHVQDVGWQGKRKNGKVAGTQGKGKRVEALRVWLTGGLKKTYDVWYRTYVSNVGWLGWACNGEDSGTSGQSRYVEAIEVALVQKGQGAPEASDQAVSAAFAGAGVVRYRAMERGSWKGWKKKGTAGTTGKSVPVQAINARASISGVKGSLKYATRMGNDWQGWVSGEPSPIVAGASVRALRMKLTGELAKFYDVWYRTHVSQAGWLGWAKNGQVSGSTGLSLEVEGYQVRLVPKGQKAPGSTKRRTIDATSTLMHNIKWAGQPNNYYCGPASGYMVLRHLGIRKAPDGTPLTMENVARSMNTDTDGTGFTNLDFENGMNYWLGKDAYRSYAYPSYTQLKNAIVRSFKTGYPVILFAHERRGYAHYNAHNDSTYSHVIVVDGYNQLTDAVYMADPGAGEVWPAAQQKFWYPSLRTFVKEFLTPYPWRNDYGMIVVP